MSSKKSSKYNKLLKMVTFGMLTTLSIYTLIEMSNSTSSNVQTKSQTKSQNISKMSRPKTCNTCGLYY